MSPLRILIIDDSPDDRAEIRRMLLKGSDRHYIFSEAASGKEGIAIATGEMTPDCILLDYSLLDMEAPEVLRILQQNSNLPPCPVVVLTGSSNVGREVIHAGAQDYLGKDWASAPALTRSVENALERYSLEKARNEASSALKVSEQFSRTILQSSPDGVVVMDTTGRINLLNHPFEKMLNIPSGSELVSKSWFELLPSEFKESAQEAFSKACEGQTSNFEQIRISPSGHLEWWEVRLSSIQDCSGKIEHIIAVSRNVTERRLAQEILQETSNQLNLGLKASGVGLIHVDYSRNAYHFTPDASRLFGIGPQKTILSETEFYAAIDPVDAVDFQTMRAANRVHLLADPVVTDFRLLSSTEEVRWLRSYEQISPDLPEGSGVRSMIALMDITDQKKAEIDLLESAERKDDFLSMLAHELRNPLAPLLTGADLIERNISNPHTVSEFCGMVKRHVSHMSRLIEDLIDLSRLNHSKIELQFSQVSLSDVIHQAVESIQPMIDQKSHRLTIQLPAEDLTFTGDHDRLIQIISNLLSNAARYTDQGGLIELSAHASPSRSLVIKIKDNGRGIALDHQKDVFKMFNQGQRGQSEGLGIGLTLVKSLVDLHKGSISLKSDGLGTGCEFFIDIPISFENTILPHKTNVTLPAPSDKKWKILIADDGRTTADVLGMFFKMEGLDCQVAYDGEQAIQKAKDFKPHIVCLDLGMPIIDGYQCAAQLREFLSNEVYLVALSGWGRDEDRKKTANVGFDEHLTKPVTPTDLRNLLSRVMCR